MNPPAITLREPTFDDAAALGDLHVETWRETYGQLMPASAFDDAARAARVEMWQGTLQRPERDGTLLVAETKDQLIGFAGAAPSTDEHTARPLELRMLYVLAEHHGSGAGQALLEAVIGDNPAFLWVAKDNPRARRFYERNRFTTDGAEAVYIQATGFMIVRMVR